MDCVMGRVVNIFKSGRLPHARPKAQRDLMRYLQAAFEAGELERRPVQWKVWRNGVRFRFEGLAPAVWINSPIMACGVRR